MILNVHFLNVRCLIQSWKHFSSDLNTWYTTLLQNKSCIFLHTFPYLPEVILQFFLLWFGWGFVGLVDVVAFVFHDTAWTLVKPQWRLFEAFGGGRARIQSNLVRIHLDLSLRVVSSRIWCVSSRIWGVSSRIWGVSGWVGVLKNFNGGVERFHWGVGHFQWGL